MVAERDSPDRDGYLLVPSLMDRAVLARLRSRLGELVREAVAARDPNPEQKIADQASRRRTPSSTCSMSHSAWAEYSGQHWEVQPRMPKQCSSW